MRKFEVTIKQIEVYVFEIEAEDESAAVDKSYELLETTESRHFYHSDSQSESEAYEL